MAMLDGVVFNNSRVVPGEQQARRASNIPSIQVSTRKDAAAQT